MSKNEYIVDGTAKVAKLNSQHEFCYRYADDIIATMTEDERIKSVTLLPLTVKVSVYADSVSEAEKAALNSLDPMFSFDVQSVRRV